MAENFDVTVVRKIEEISREIRNIKASKGVRGLPVIPVQPLLYCNFDGAAPYNSDFSGNSYSYNLIAPTIFTGIFRPGRFEKGVQITYATTNLVTNPSIESDTTGWAAGTVNTTISSSTEKAYFGTHSLKIVTTDINGYAKFPITLSGSTVYTSSLWVYSELGATVFTKLTDNSDQDLQSDDFSIPAGVWTRIYSTGTTDAHTSRILEVYLELAGTIYIDGIQIEQKAYATPYCDGSLGIGHTWSGTAHASTSSRTVEQVKYPSTLNAQNKAGTIAGIFSFTKTGENYFWSGDGSGYLSCCSYSNNTLIGVSFRGVSTPIFVTWAPENDTYYYIAVTWNTTGMKLYVDGELIGTHTGSMAGINMSSNLVIGEYDASSSKLNGICDDFIVLDYELTQNEISSYYHSNAAWMVRSVAGLTVNIGEGIEIYYDTIQLKLSTPSGLYLDSSGLSIDDTIAGDGLSITNKILSVDLASPSGLSFSTSKLTLDDSVAGNGLTITSKVLAVGAGNGINVSSDSIAVKLNATASGLSLDSNGLALADSTAGSGLTIASKVLAVGEGNGISVSSDSIAVKLNATASGLFLDSNGLAMAIPASLSVSTTNAVTSSHTHAIDSNNDPGAASKILSTDSNGLIRLQLLEMHDLISSDDYASQTTGWGIAINGSADFRYLYADEMHAKSFIADMEQALAGGQIICKSVAVVASNFSIPSAGSAATLVVEDLPGSTGAVFVTGDIVRLRQFTRGTGSLTVADVWGVVTSFSSNGDGTQNWTFTRSSGSNAGSGSGTVAKGTLALDYGTTGNGFYEVNSVDGSFGANSPYAQIVTWTTHPATGQAILSRWGKLSGISGMASDEYGLYINQSTYVYAKLSNKAFQLRGIDLQLYNGTTQTVQMESDGDIWFGKSSSYKSFQHTASEGDIEIGQYTASNAGMLWDQSATTLYIKGNGSGITSINGGNITTNTITLDKLMTGTLGVSKTLTFGNPSGARLVMATDASNNATLTGYNSSGVAQAYFGSDGVLYGGGGNVYINGDGVTIAGGSSYEVKKSLKLTSDAKVRFYATSNGTAQTLTTWMYSDASAASGWIGGFNIRGVGHSGSTVSIWSSTSGASAQLEMSAGMLVSGINMLATKIGIGTSNPSSSYLLDINGSVHITSGSMLSVADTNHGMLYSGTVDGPLFRGYGGFLWGTGDSGSYTRMRLDTSALYLYDDAFRMNTYNRSIWGSMAHAARVINTASQHYTTAWPNWQVIHFNTRTNLWDGGANDDTHYKLGTATAIWDSDTALYARDNGWYTATGGFAINTDGAAVAPGRVVCKITKNGSVDLATAEAYIAPGYRDTTVNVSTGPFYMTSGQYIQMFCLQNAYSAGYTIYAASQTNHTLCFFSLTRVA